MNRIFHVYIVPAAVFISVVMGGGYGTGREVIEFFTRYGLLGGLLGTAAAACVFAVVLACTYEFARVFQVYDYRTFFSRLIGPFWVCFEILYLLLFLLVLGVVSSAAGNMLEQEFAISRYFGMAGVLVLVVALVYFGRAAVEKVLTLWSIGMYLVFGYYFIEILNNGEVDVFQAVGRGSIESGWLQGGVLYAMYNLAIAPVLLFSTRAIQTRREAVLAGIIHGSCRYGSRGAFPYQLRSRLPGCAGAAGSQLLDDVTVCLWVAAGYFPGCAIGHPGGDRRWAGTGPH